MLKLRNLSLALLLAVTSHAATQFSGGTYVNTTFTGAVRSDIQANLKTQLLAAGWTNVAQAASQGPGDVFNFTVTIASPGVFTKTAHGFLGGERVILQTTGALPTGLTANTVYFIKYIDADTFNMATTSGGSNINTSGSQSGTHTLNAESILLQSATQSNVTNPVRIRLMDNRGNCIQIHIENQAGTVKSGSQTSSSFGGNLLPAAAKSFRVIATKYHFLCFTAATSAAREFVMAGMLYVPALLTGVTDHGYMLSNSTSDSSTTLASSFRTVPSGTPGTTNVTGNVQVLWNSSFFENAGSTNSAGSVGWPQYPITAVGDANSVGRLGNYRWANDDILTSDVLMSSGLASTADEGKIKGQFYDVLYIADAFAGDATDTFNSHTWFNITQNNTGGTSVNVRGGMWVATN